MPVDRLTHVCEKCERNREGLPEIPVEHVDGRGPGWKCDECGWWNWIVDAPADRLTQIRHNWQEKGNGPRGRDVDFLLAALSRSPADFIIEQEQRRRAERAEAALEQTALPATESAQPEEESG